MPKVAVALTEVTVRAAAFFSRGNHVGASTGLMQRNIINVFWKGKAHLDRVRISTPLILRNKRGRRPYGKSSRMRHPLSLFVQTFTFRSSFHFLFLLSLLTLSASPATFSAPEDFLYTEPFVCTAARPVWQAPALPPDSPADTQSPLPVRCFPAESWQVSPSLQ